MFTQFYFSCLHFFDTHPVLVCVVFCFALVFCFSKAFFGDKASK